MKIKIKIKIIVIVIIILILLIYCISFYRTRIASYAFVKAKEVSQEKIANVLTDVLTKIDTTNILEAREVNINKLNNIRKVVENRLLEDQNDTYETVKIPYGIVISEVLFANSDFTLDAKIRRTSSFTVDMQSTITEYGINSSVLQIDMIVSFEILILIPYQKEMIQVDTKIPVAILVLEGNIPNGIIYKQN